VDEYRIAIELRAAYLYAEVSGPNTVETIARYAADVGEAARRLQQLRVLVVVNLHGPGISMLDVYKAVSAGADAAASLGMRVAYVDANPEHGIENMHLAEDVAATRGIPVRTFRDVAAAEAWLLSGSNPDAA
jgi:hypothetical protein